MSESEALLSRLQEPRQRCDRAACGAGLAEGPQRASHRHPARRPRADRDAQGRGRSTRRAAERLRDLPGRHDDGTADIVAAGKKLRVAVSPSIDAAALRPGQEVMLNESLNVIDAMPFEDTGEIVILKEFLGDGDRALVLGRADEERVVRVAQPLREMRIRAGDSLLCDVRAGYVFERIPKSEVEELILEEVPDIQYEDIGGLGEQIETIRDAVELPVHAPGAVRRARPQAAEGHPPVRPARLRQDPDRQGGGELAGQEGGRAHRPRGGPIVLPEHQGSRAAQQVRGRDRAAHPPGLPARPGEGLGGHAGHRVLRRDGLAVPHARLGRVQRRREHDRSPAAERDRRRREPRERHRDRRLEPRGHDRPGDPAAGTAGREDQDRAPGRRGRPRHLQQVPGSHPARCTARTSPSTAATPTRPAGR